MGADDEKQNVAVLVGNGLSVAFNPRLNLRAITEEMVKRIAAATEDGTDVVATMKKIALQALPVGATTDDDFEILVGAFGAETRTLSYLRLLGGMVSPEDNELGAAVEKVTTFVQQIRDTGLSYVLEVILEESRGLHDESAELHSFVETILDGFDGKLTFGNLNYDTLLLASLLAKCQNDLVDMGHGWRKVTLVGNGGATINVPELRKTPEDFLDRRVKLLHLHGSLTYWANTERTIFAKLGIPQLHDHQQWQAVRDQDTRLRPVVVLANQRDKSSHVTEFPFALAYEMFVRGLVASDHWLVVGYSFRDDCVNDVLRAEFSERMVKPKVLVVTYGEMPSRHEVERAFGWAVDEGNSNDWLTINRDGAFEMKNSQDWKNFTL